MLNYLLANHGRGLPYMRASVNTASHVLFTGPTPFRQTAATADVSTQRILVISHSSCVKMVKRCAWGRCNSDTRYIKGENIRFIRYQSRGFRWRSVWGEFEPVDGLVGSSAFIASTNTNICVLKWFNPLGPGDAIWRQGLLSSLAQLMPWRRTGARTSAVPMLTCHQ